MANVSARIKGRYEMGYFDAHLKDGATIVVRVRGLSRKQRRESGGRAGMIGIMPPINRPRFVLGQNQR
jgi:hypothetical protein